MSTGTEMVHADALDELIELVERATGPDRQLDRAIIETIDPDCKIIDEMLHVTSSLDASLALVNEVMPEHWPHFEIHARMVRSPLANPPGSTSQREWWHQWDITVPSREFYGRTHRTPALALLSALLRALKAKQEARSQTK